LLAAVVYLWPTSHDRLKIEIKAVVATKTSPNHGMRLGSVFVASTRLLCWAGELNWSPRLSRQLGAGILTLRGSNSDSLDMRSAVLGKQLGGPSKDVANMAEVFRGLYRTIAWAYVTNGTMAFQVPEANYRAFGYEPNYDNLPWKEDYEAAKGHEDRFKY
jgi:hypothetical protein